MEGEGCEMRFNKLTYEKTWFKVNYEMPIKEEGEKLVFSKFKSI